MVAAHPDPVAPWHSAPSWDHEAEKMLASLYADRVDDVADTIITKLAGAFPQANQLGDDFVQDVLEKAQVTLRRVVQLLGTGESFELMGPLIEDVARQRRRQAISQEMIFFGYRYLQHVLFEEITDGIRDHPQAQRLTDAMALRQLEFQWVVARRVAAAFDTGPEALAASREEAVQAVLDMLVGQRADISSLAEQAAQLGLLLPLNHVAVTVASAEAQGPGAVDDGGVRPVARANPWSVVGALNGRIVVVGRGVPWRLAPPWGGCAIADEALSRPDLMASRVALAGSAADVAARLGMDHADADEVAPFIAVAGISTERQDVFLQSLFGDLHTSSRGLPILKAVAVSAGSAGRREAASRLKVHPNTLDYRLTRFRELTGINLTDPVQRLRCDLGLFLLGMLGE